MRKRLFANRPLWIGAIVLLGLFWVGSRPFTDSDRWPEPDAKINPDFQKHPPIAKMITLELLDQPLPNGSNVIMTASFDEATRARIGSKFLAMNMAAITPVDPATRNTDANALAFLRDDGYDGDEKADDGRYTRSFKENDPAWVINYLQKRAASANEPQNKYKFVNRQMVLNTELSNLVSVASTHRGTIAYIKGGLFDLNVLKPSQDMIDHSLMITDLSVVEDPDRTYNPCTNKGKATGAWVFGELMRQMASPNPGAIANDAQTIDFIRKWLATWNKPRIVNGELVPARPTTSIINTWTNLSAANGAAPGQLLLENCPFRLMAIVNRVDLRGNSIYGPNDAGEGRLVYCLLDDNCNALRMTTIFEYGVPLRGCDDVKAYAQRWADLEAIAFGDPAFNSQLQDITDIFTLCGANPSKPNENAINQVRTDELALGFSPWELREFNLMPVGLLQNVTVKQEPAVKYNVQTLNPDVMLLANWVNANTADILAGIHQVPDQVTGIDFLGGKAHTQSPPTGPPPFAHHWDADPNPASPAFITNDDARHLFSLATCSGCHGGETQTSFTHIDPTPFGSVAHLSEFLTGDVTGLPNTPFLVTDAANRPAGSPTVRGFNDLWRRALDLQDLIDLPCGSIIVALENLSVNPISAQH